ncbi:MAG: GNAT family N-acetyltransferase [Planctomycetaceae bacterium]
MTTERANITLRREVTADDSAQIARLVAATGFFNAAEIAIALEIVEERLAKGTASDYEFVIAEEDSKVVGYACFGEIPCTVGSYDLYWIVVDPEQQRSGIGRMLMHDVEQRVGQRTGRGIYIDTSGRDQYSATRSFYERCGYECVASLPDFYAPGDAKCIYWKRFVQNDENTARGLSGNSERQRI